MPKSYLTYDVTNHAGTSFQGEAPTHQVWTWLDLQFRSLQHFFYTI